jgi:hypothetical protein
MTQLVSFNKERFLQKDWHHTASHQTRFDMLQKKYQYYSFGKFCFFCLVCSDYHYCVISLNFNAKYPNKHIVSEVKVYDSLEEATEECVKNGSIHADYLMTPQNFFSTFSFNNALNNEILLTHIRSHHANQEWLAYFHIHPNLTG